MKDYEGDQLYSNIVIIIVLKIVIPILYVFLSEELQIKYLEASQRATLVLTPLVMSPCVCGQDLLLWERKWAAMAC